YQQAAACLDQAADSATAARLRAVCLLAEGQPEKAAEQVRHARQLGEVSPELAVLESELLEQQGEIGSAEAVLQQAIQQWPAWAGLYYRLGNVQKQLGQDQQAETTLQTWQKYRDLATELTQLNLKAIEEPFNAEIRDRLAVVCSELQKPELAEMWKTAAEACRKDTASPAATSAPQG
ncbi:MAG: tetratricopeptide repeat protein, partial [Planctomycetaceae bacterium]